MSYIDTRAMKSSTVFNIYTNRDEYQIDPEYQRSGGIWTLEKKQLLIDSILNDYDIPKIYFHRFPRKEFEKTRRTHAVIDGRQRLESIWQFIENGFALGDSFSFLKDSSIDLSGMTYKDLGAEYPKIKNNFDGTTLPIIEVETDDLELIEDMFSRLNEAVPLNAAEKRNAIGGDLIRTVNSVSNHRFFKQKVRISNRRYQHREMAIRLLWLEECEKKDGRIIDTKKVYLDLFAKTYKSGNSKHVSTLKGTVVENLDRVAEKFTDKDQLLGAQATIPIYYLAAGKLNDSGEMRRFTRTKLMEFNRQRQANRVLAEDNFADAKFVLLEYDRLSQQGTNDATSIKERVEILQDYLLARLKDA